MLKLLIGLVILLVAGAVWTSYLTFRTWVRVDEFRVFFPAMMAWVTVAMAVVGTWWERRRQ